MRSYELSRECEKTNSGPVQVNMGRRDQGTRTLAPKHAPMPNARDVIVDTEFSRSFPKWQRALALFAVIATIRPSVDAKRNRYIVPGAPWYDTDGNVLSAHAGGIVEHDGKWYWFGQNERAEDKDLFSGTCSYHPHIFWILTIRPTGCTPNRHQRLFLLRPSQLGF
ncbi:hypothetical protein K435DRAFT_879470 [Dendrothele bispora CBS 962.96]|uniref:Uncharacterized protein n=1 Tax=Dendrothele bispora (strain CBS 962.96) TaxID=1314807 RepID=A0A4S8KM23_DENBC|nr:hypothetical protein K435DRAFT_879470 [Dendrothele bispora CBS 962.96]